MGEARLSVTWSQSAMRHGFYFVSFWTPGGWPVMDGYAVVDDFGNLVAVP